MKNLFNLFVISTLFLCPNLFSKELVVFHFNFSFERDYNYTNPNKWILTEEVENIIITLLSPNKHIKWKRNFTKSELPKDENGYCLFSDTIKTLVNSSKPYTLKVRYLLASGIDDSSELPFAYPDSVKKLALELFFDQALVKRMFDDKINGLPDDDYEIDANPKPSLIVKYLNCEHNIYLGPTWFENGLTKRPKYVIYNKSQNGIFRLNNDWLTCFFGNLFILDSNSTCQHYLFGPVCGTINCQDTIGPNQTYDTVEGYPIAREPRKLLGGYYKYSVLYKDFLGNERTVSTYFSVIYSR